MSNREHILQTARRFAIETGSVPSMDAIAHQAGVSKGGLMHHFKSRAALVEGIAVQAIQDMDQELTAAAGRGNVIETWLRLSSSREEAALYRAMLILLTDRPSMTDTLMQQAAAATERWEQLFAIETGDPTAASVIRLLGDGMLLNSITDDYSAPGVDAILQWLDHRSTR
ncbi:TetR/AcrR family transcriptional regulator [Cryobacterium sp. TMT2-18-3]|uniref:TetR/AcrR family transcriptional regulator n=1 Tax=unclassified Cryobacterium TaxID=2649013 RepID=UPI00106BBABB|nr:MULTISPECIES: TetR/AcrR family transcriptional regulator [unclassified Cryobacterium]TFC24320.1 TetR/AcrR family transcriptional regulator [Cryobacterium sp. TMT2-18-2]TFC39599.1 TetR/AcrR family transcriptional regulator [Cryobacterium sp. TMT2-42-4]TFC61274.1 TetR/AcrR family transcriptional regulator [Cryobacterium sp. TMT2-18-3]